MTKSSEEDRNELLDRAAEGEVYVNLGEAAGILGVSRRHVSSMIKTGKLKAIISPLDAREKLIARSDLHRLERFAHTSKTAA